MRELEKYKRNNSSYDMDAIRDHLRRDLPNHESPYSVNDIVTYKKPFVGTVFGVITEVSVYSNANGWMYKVATYQEGSNQVLPATLGENDFELAGNIDSEALAILELEKIADSEIPHVDIRQKGNGNITPEMWDFARNHNQVLRDSEYDRCMEIAQTIAEKAQNDTGAMTDRDWQILVTCGYAVPVGDYNDGWITYMRYELLKTPTVQTEKVIANSGWIIANA